MLLLGMGAFWMIGGGDDAGKADPEIQDGNGNGPTDDSLLGQPIRVGQGGQFPTLNKALSYVRKHYDPLDAEGPQEIRLAAGEVFPERIDLENRYMAKQPFPEQIRITTDAKNPATLKPSGASPVIRLADGVKDLHIENLVIDATGKSTAIKLQGDLAKTQLRKLTLKGYQKTGIAADSIFGSPPLFNKQGTVVFDGVTFRGSGANTTGLLLENTGDIVSGSALQQEILVQNCRFLGLMKAGLEVKSGVKSLRVLSNIFAGDGKGAGIEFTGNTALDRVIVGNNTFYNLAQGVTFAQTPGSVNEFGLQRNLFADIKNQEAALLKGDADKFAKQDLKGNAIDANWTTGDKTKPGDKQELKLFTGKTAQAGLKLTFTSKEPGDPRFLAPADAGKLPKPSPPAEKVGKFEVDLQPYIGAVKP